MLYKKLVCRGYKINGVIDLHYPLKRHLSKTFSAVDDTREDDQQDYIHLLRVWQRILKIKCLKEA